MTTNKNCNRSEDEFDPSMQIEQQPLSDGLSDNPCQSPSPPESFDSENFLKQLSTRPGVYRMIDSKGVVLYVGKAKNLKNRVSSYFRKTGLTAKTSVMVSQVAKVEVTLTHTESEALLLENNLIKALKPRYNILLRDDKSYPYIYLSEHNEFPRLSFHRGAKNKPGRYFGPYPNGHSVRSSLNLLQKLFPVRQCEDSFFRNRSRACLQYQIHRCSGPCVDLVSKQDYAQDVRHTIMFLEGKSNQVIDELVARMDLAAKQLRYEQAAGYRDQIADLRRLQEKQYVSNEKGNLDVIALAFQKGIACIQVFFIRDGLNLGNKSFFPKNVDEQSADELLSAFFSQYYVVSGHSDRLKPGIILVSQDFEDREILEQVLSHQAGHKITIRRQVRGERVKWVEMAIANAETALQSRLTHKANIVARFEALQQTLGFSQTPKRLECFDISHSSGEATVASCVVFDHSGPLKADYRRFNIKNVTPGDDYAAMHQALTRRYLKFKKGEGKLPDLLIIDGGKGQVSQAVDVMNELQIDGIEIIGITKGEGRKAEYDTLLLSKTKKKVILPANSQAMHLIQHIRDEAHRFAITGHKNRRDKARKTSELENIQGLGPKRRQLILKQFGGLQEVVRAGIDDLSNIPGISKALAQKIYDHFHR